MSPHQPAGDVIDVHVRAELDGIAVARRAVVAGLAGRVAPRVLGDAELVVSELVTNSVLHGALRPEQLVRVVAELGGPTLHLRVQNAGTSGRVARRAPDDVGIGGFGLRLVDTLALSWGVARGADTEVWLELERWPEGG